MKKILGLLFVVSILFLAVLFGIKLYRENLTEGVYKNKVKELSNNLAEKSTELIQKEKALMEPVRNSIEKVEKKTEERVDLKGISVSYQLVNLGPAKKRIDLYLEGASGMSMDAADIVLHVQNASVGAIQTGEAFPSYPRASIAGDTITITGVALLGQSHVEFGTVNKKLASFEVEKKEPSQKTTLLLETVGTGVYLLGEGVFDQEHSFSSIEW